MLQTWFFGYLAQGVARIPRGAGRAQPLPLLAVAGLLVSSVTLRYLPREGWAFPGRRLPRGWGTPDPIDLPGVLLAALATLSLGVVLGPEAPLIAMGGGLGVLAVHLAKRDAEASPGPWRQ